MRVAICGFPSLAQQMKATFKDIDFKFFIRDFLIDSGTVDLPLISFFEFRRLTDAGELDGVIIADNARSYFTKGIIPIFKLYAIPKVGVFDKGNVFNPIYILDPDKAYIPHLETNLVDACNLNCKGCTHFAGLFGKGEIYPLETFRRDVRRLSQTCDIVKFRLLGGEPLLLKNLDEYIKVACQYLPKTRVQIVTNGLLIPSMSQRFFDTLRENKCDVDISIYSPTLKIADKIKEILRANGIAFHMANYKDEFHVFLTLHPGNNPVKARSFCFNDNCRFLRDGKVYKCPPDALSYRFTERFGIEGFPKATGIDLYASNFSSMLEHLESDVEMCGWYSDKQARLIAWEPTNKPQLEDWLADPDELKNF